MAAETHHIGWLVLSLGIVLASHSHAALTVPERTSLTDEYRITYWTSEQGLPQNTVVSLLQSAQGYLGIGTRYGLARFDGLRLTDYSADLGGLDPDELDVRSLAEDSEGCLWIQTHAALVCYRQGRFSRVQFDSAPFPGHILSICARSKGGLWLAYEGGLAEFSRNRLGQTLRLGRDLLPSTTWRAMPLPKKCTSGCACRTAA